MPQAHSLRPPLALAIVLAVLFSAPLRGEAGENDCGTLPDTTGAGSSPGAGTWAWVQPAAEDTVGMLIVFAKFPDGDDLTHCDTTSAGGWPDADEIPSWAGNLIEDTDTPSVEGSLSHFFFEMSEGKHLIKGSVYPEVVEVDSTIGYYNSVHGANMGGAQVADACGDVVRKVMADLQVSAKTKYDLSRAPDGFVDELFIIFRSPRSTGGGTITDLEFAGISKLLAADSLFIFGADTVGVGGSGTNAGGGAIFWQVVGDPTNGVRNINQWSMFQKLAHEYAHDLQATRPHIATLGPFGIMDGTLPTGELDSGGIVSAYNRYIAGWITPTEIDSTVGTSGNRPRPESCGKEKWRSLRVLTHPAPSGAKNRRPTPCRTIARLPTSSHSPTT